MRDKSLIGLDEMFPELIGYKPPLYKRIYYWFVVEWANLKGRIRNDKSFRP